MSRGLYPFDVLIPRGDLEKWAVIACDQYTSERSYWDGVRDFVAGSASAYNIVVPEAYLQDSDVKNRIAHTNEVMTKYLRTGVFDCFENSMVYVERMQSNGQVRKGIVGVIDLKDYEFRNNAPCLVRPTEDVVESRLPARLAVREGACLESSHVLLFMGDKEDSLMKSIDKDVLPKLYDFNLYPNGENIQGYQISGELVEELQEKFLALCDNGVQFLVADGNHSIATAKEYYNAHPDNPLARYAMVEVINSYDEGLIFEPIHRIVYNCDPKKVLDDLLNYYPGSVKGVAEGHHLAFYSAGENCVVTIPFKYNPLAVGVLQRYLDQSGLEVDYIHSAQDVKEWSRRSGTAGFVLEGMDVDGMFEYILNVGRLPKKTFSIGHQEDKKYYLECRKIV